MMKRTYLSIPILLACMLLPALPALSQCENTDFEYGNFTNWQGFTGACCGGGINVPGIVNGRHTIITQSTFDPNTNFLLSTMPPAGGGAYSVRLGNENVGSEAERLVRSFSVTSDNRLFIYQYAVVLQDPEDHPPNDKPKFEVKVYDQNGAIINPQACGYYEVTAGPETNDWAQYETVRYKDWSTVGIDLSAYIGTTVTIEFMVQDCGWGGHYGYAYLDASCGYLDIQVLGFCEGSETVTLIAPSGFDEYFWPQTGDTTQAITIPAPEVGDTVAVQVTNQSGCVTNILHIFEELPLVQAAVGPDASLCAGEPIDLAAADSGPNVNYSWTANGVPISGQQYLTVTPLTTTVYEVTVSNANGCFSPDSSASLTVTVNDDLVFQLPDDTLICEGSSFTLNAPLANVNYVWYTLSGSIGTGASVTVTPFETETYYLQVSNGICSFTDSLQISVFNANSFPDILPFEFCPGDSVVTIFGPDYFSSFTWENGETTQATNVNPYSDSMILLVVITPAGCPDSIFYLLNETDFPIPVAFTTDDTICPEHATLLEVMSNTPATYSWSTLNGDYVGSGSGIYVAPEQTTTYVVQATTTSVCSSSDSFDTITVFVDTASAFSFGGQIPVCSGTTDTIFAPASGLSYEWFNSSGTVLSTDSLLVLSPSANQTIYLTIHSGACSFSDYVMVTVAPVFTFVQTVPGCMNADVPLTSPPQYTDVYWPLFGNNALSNTLSDPADNQVIPLYAQNQFGCTDTVRFVLDLMDPGVLQASPDQTICSGAPAYITAQSSHSYDTFMWSSSSGSMTANGASMTDFPDQTTSYTVTVSNEYDCAPEPQTVLITVLSDYLIDPIAPVAVCPGNAITLTAPGTSGTYSWNYEGTQSAQPELVFTPQQSGIVSLTVTEGACSSSTTIAVTVFTPVDYALQTSAGTICDGEHVLLQVLPGGFTNIDWLFNSNYVTSNTTGMDIEPQAPVIVTAVVSDPNGCISDVSQQVLVDEMPQLELGPDLVVCNADSILLSAPGIPGNYTFGWSTSETTPAITVTDPGVYSLTVVNGVCSATDAIYVQFMADSYLGIIPNIITPNGDLLNDVFEIPSLNLVSYDIVIVNRWGNTIFSSGDPTDFWDGKTTEKQVDEGVYFYLIHYKTNCETEERTVQGHVTVNRD